MAALLGVTDYCGPIGIASLSRHVQPRLLNTPAVPPDSTISTHLTTWSNVAVFLTFTVIDLDLWYLLVVVNMSSLDSDSVHGADSGEAGEPGIEPEFNDVRTLPVRP
jgi:hypothetical protein